MFVVELVFRMRKVRMILLFVVGYVFLVILVELGNFLIVYLKILCFIISCLVVGFVFKLDRYFCVLNVLWLFCGCCIYGILCLFVIGDILGF